MRRIGGGWDGKGFVRLGGVEEVRGDVELGYGGVGMPEIPRFPEGLCCFGAYAERLFE